MTYIGSIDLRRIWIADEERGLVFAYTMFRHPLDAPNKNYPVLLADGTISDRSMNFEPFDLEPRGSCVLQFADGRVPNRRIHKWRLEKLGSGRHGMVRRRVRAARLAIAPDTVGGHSRHRG
jgi:hypothetical protein